MNPAHMEYCASEDWRRLVHETILPVALARRGAGRRGDRDRPRARGSRPTSCAPRRRTSPRWSSTRAWRRAWRERMAGGNVEVVVGDATALGLRRRSASPVRPPSTCSTTSRPPRPRTASSPSWPGCWSPGARWWRPTGSTARAARVFHQDDTYNPIDPEELEPRLDRRRLRVGAGAHVRPRVGVHGSTALTAPAGGP